jgi:ESS family glutamate:Na+ symporter
MILNRSPFKYSVDQKVESRIGSMVSDYLVGFGVASISITVVQSFALPIIILCVLGIAWPLFMVFFVGRKLFHNYWFERSIFIFGWCTGVVAIGVTLLRICDPEMKSKTLDDYGSAYTVISIIEVFLVAITPQLAVMFGCSIVGAVELAIGIALFLICAKIYGVHKGKMSDLREGELSE